MLIDQNAPRILQKMMIAQFSSRFGNKEKDEGKKKNIFPKFNVPFILNLDYEKYNSWTLFTTPLVYHTY
jgi:hypothetical protein